jgi:hypothetical protein
MNQRRFFLAGIIQGSWQDDSIHQQDYRKLLKNLLVEHFEGAEVYDPQGEHEESVAYDESEGRRVFFTHNMMCRNDIDVLIAFVPEASMGTAVEMWEAYQSGAAVFAISPMNLNWAVRFLSHEIFPDLTAFEEEVRSGSLAQCIDAVLENRRDPVRDVLGKE